MAKQDKKPAINWEHYQHLFKEISSERVSAKELCIKKDMRTLIVFNHPYEGSYCNAVLTSVLAGLRRAGHEADLLH